MKTTTPTPKTTPLMKKLSLNLLLLLSLAAGISSCQKTEVEPKAPASVTAAQDVSVTTYTSRKAYLFLRTPGPFGLGHTGVGYILVRKVYDPATQSSKTNYVAFCGGVENPSAKPFVKPGQTGNGGWFETKIIVATPGRDPFLDANSYIREHMKLKGYNRMKYEVVKSQTVQHTVRLAEGNNVYNEAGNVIRNFPTRGYALARNNCMNAAYDVLAALGAPGVATPDQNWTPTDQFENTGNGGGWSPSYILQ
jgi:hypothetical protein